MPLVSWLSDCACCTADSAICAISSVAFFAPVITSSIELAVSVVKAVPCLIMRSEFSIRLEVFCAASALLFARLCTSFATTAKPFPASPARAASTEALSARILVWNEMSSMVLMIPPIWLAAFEMSCIAEIRVRSFWSQTISAPAAWVEQAWAVSASSEVLVTW